MKKEIKQDLLTLYMEEIGYRLPKQGKQDILNEIRSLILDTLEDRALTYGKPIDDTLTIEVLKEFGSPEKMALQYGKTNFLIGPRYYSLYTKILRIVITVVIGISLVGFGFGLAESAIAPTSIFVTIAELIGGLFSAAFQTFGIITLIFWGIERSTPGFDQVKQEEWHPEKLLENGMGEHIKIGGYVAEITAMVIALVIFNFFQRYLGLVTYSAPENQWQFFPILADAFARYLPYINGFYIASIFLNLYILNRGILDKIARWGGIMLDAFSIAILYAMAVGPDLLKLDANDAFNSSYQGLIEAIPELNEIIKILLPMAAIGILVKIIIQVYRLIFKQTHLPIEEMIESIESIESIEAIDKK